MANLFDGKNVKPMLIGARAQAFDSPDYIYELKMDGERCIAYLDPITGTDLRNKRSVAMLPKVPELSGIHEQVNARCILDGELVVIVDGVPSFYEVMRRSLTSDKYKIQLQSARNPATFVAFDILYHVDHEVTSWTVMQRKELLEQVVAENERLVISRYIEEHGVLLFNLAVERNLEGIVAKRKESRYYQDKRTKDWIKSKNLEDDDFVACGYIEKDGFLATIVLGQYEGEVLKYKGHVAIGRSSSAFRILEAHPRVQDAPFRRIPAGCEGVVWIRTDLICTVSYMANMPGGGIRHPIFKGFRME